MMFKSGETQNWVDIISKYNTPSVKKSIWQIINSLGPYLVLWYLMYLSMEISYWITLGFSVLAAGFLVRIFIIFHDCGHGSFFRSKKANKIVGTLLGSLVFTPYDRWHVDHGIHHKTVGNLDKRGFGDIWTLTVKEYQTTLPAKEICLPALSPPHYAIWNRAFLPLCYLVQVSKKRLAEKRAI